MGKSNLMNQNWARTAVALACAFLGEQKKIATRGKWSGKPVSIVELARHIGYSKQGIHDWINKYQTLKWADPDARAEMSRLSGIAEWILMLEYVDESVKAKGMKKVEEN